MSKVNMIIEEFYEKVAKSILSDNVNALPEDTAQNKKIKLAVLVEKDYKHIDIQEEFLIMLDDIDIAVFGTVDESNTYVKYYKDFKVFDDDIDAAEIIGKAIKIKDSSITAKSIICEIKKELLEKNSYMRIAELYYYKKNHKWYEQEVEEAFKEVVYRCLSNNSDILFTKSIDNNITQITENIIEEAEETTYSDIYKNARIQDKYKLSYNDYHKSLQETLFKVNKNIKIGKNYNNDKFDSYLHEVMLAFKNEQYASLEECREYYNKKYKQQISKTPYPRFFRCTILYLAGFNYGELWDEYILGREFILKTIIEDLNKVVHYYYFIKFKKTKSVVEEYVVEPWKNKYSPNQIIKKKMKRERLVKSRFCYIDNIKDLFAMRELIKVCEDIVISANNKATHKINVYDYMAKKIEAGAIKTLKK